MRAPNQLAIPFATGSMECCLHLLTSPPLPPFSSNLPESQNRAFMRVGRRLKTYLEYYWPEVCTT